MDKKEKQAMYKFLLLTAPFWIGALVAVLFPIYRNFAYKSYERIVNAVSSTINSEQQSYKFEFEYFQKKFEKDILSQKRKIFIHYKIFRKR